MLCYCVLCYAVRDIGGLPFVPGEDFRRRGEGISAVDGGVIRGL